jgi:hypothetical protein
VAGKTVDSYIAEHTDWRRETLESLRDAIRTAAPEAHEAFKWAQPVYESNGPFAYFRSFPRSVNVGFWRGAQLDDPDSRLDGGGDRMRHMTIREGEPVERELISAWVRQAIELNEQHGNPTRRARSSGNGESSA